MLNSVELNKTVSEYWIHLNETNLKMTYNIFLDAFYESGVAHIPALYEKYVKFMYGMSSAS